MHSLLDMDSFPVKWFANLKGSSPEKALNSLARAFPSSRRRGQSLRTNESRRREAGLDGKDWFKERPGWAWLRLNGSYEQPWTRYNKDSCSQGAQQRWDCFVKHQPWDMNNPNPVVDRLSSQKPAGEKRVNLSSAVNDCACFLTWTSPLGLEECSCANRWVVTTHKPLGAGRRHLPYGATDASAANSPTLQSFAKMISFEPEGIHNNKIGGFPGNGTWSHNQPISSRVWKYSAWTGSAEMGAELK